MEETAIKKNLKTAMYTDNICIELLKYDGVNKLHKESWLLLSFYCF